MTDVTSPRNRALANNDRIRPRRDDVREAIRAAADEHFLAVGYREASVDQIARAAGFTKGAVYSNFTSKPVLFLQLVRERFTSFLNDGAASAHDHQGVSDATDVFARRIAHEIVREAPWHRCVAEFALDAASVPEVAAEYAALRWRLLDEILTHVHQAGILVSDETGQELASALLALVSGYALELGYRPDTIDEQHIARAVRGVLASFSVKPS